MLVEIINTGSELMLGRVLNTHQQWLCRRLADLGHMVTRQTAVADTAHDIQTATREALGRADLVITTGGLGPTSDDLTRNLIAELLGKKLQRDETVLAQISNYFVSRSRPVPERTMLEALVPEGALVLPNQFGTAPGLAMKLRPNPFRTGGKTSWLIMLPGPPRELHPLFVNFVTPLLQREWPPSVPFVCRTLRTTGMGESMVQEAIEKPLYHLVAAGLEIGYCARIGQVDVRLAMRDDRAAELVQEAEAIVRHKLKTFIFGEDEATLETVVVRLLTERRQTLTLAESCTGGCIAHRITNVPGASAVFMGGFVTYSNEVKEKFLDVHAETLLAHGAVSEPVAREMAEGARRQTGADFAIAVTGIAGPTGGTEDKPVGTVLIALASEQGTEAWKMFNPWERETFKEVTAQQALNQLRLALQKTVTRQKVL